MRAPASVFVAAVVLLVAPSSGRIGAAVASAPGDDELFEKQVRPLLIARCYGCHSAEAKKQKGGVGVGPAEGLRRGGASGPALVPGDAAASLLIKAIRYKDPDLQMPPDERLPEAEIAILERWIARGAPDPRRGAPVAA